MSYLLDTNVVSEVWRSQPDQAVIGWFEHVDERDLHLSVLTLGELRRGVELRRRRDPLQAAQLAGRLSTIETSYSDRILPVTAAIAARWGELGVPDPVPAVDALLAATALVHDLTLVTRNVRDYERTRVRLLNPFEPQSAP